MSIRTDKIRLSHTLVLLFSGHAGVGKTFTSDIAQKYCNTLGLVTCKESFAFGVKNTAKFLGWNGEKDVKGRKLLQDIGRIGREYDKDTWVRSTIARTENSMGYPYDVIFIDDFRFMNEFEYIEKEILYKPIPIRVIAPDREVLKGTPEANDISETEMDDREFTLYLMNRKDDFDIHGQVERTVNRILKLFNTI